MGVHFLSISIFLGFCAHFNVGTWEYKKMEEVYLCKCIRRLQGSFWQSLHSDEIVVALLVLKLKSYGVLK